MTFDSIFSAASASTLNCTGPSIPSPDARNSFTPPPEVPGNQRVGKTPLGPAIFAVVTILAFMFLRRLWPKLRKASITSQPIPKTVEICYSDAEKFSQILHRLEQPGIQQASSNYDKFLSQLGYMIGEDIASTPVRGFSVKIIQGPLGLCSTYSITSYGQFEHVKHHHAHIQRLYGSRVEFMLVAITNDNVAEERITRKDLEDLVEEMISDRTTFGIAFSQLRLFSMY
ncbi:hypothetical protein DL764_006026 [Monosporascus ibericus]|uniref:Uncharacterized protein n=1 Tax=Monosporascus ibericus TaxID=155417 RepID=A0A4Q4T6A1_9PEZI|nr:hypothetical protein DL764_006026 [Monosporascus ibericus]